MRRTTSAAEDRSESPTELIARISAEHGSPTVTQGRRHRRRAGENVDAVVTTDPLPQRADPNHARYKHGAPKWDLVHPQTSDFCIKSY